MKKLLVLGLAMILFIACQNQPQNYFNASPELETFKAGVAAYEAQDWDTWKSHYADTAKIFHNSNKGNSPDETMAGMKDMLSTLSSYAFSKENAVSEMVVDKNNKTWVNYWNTWRGKLKANGKEISIPVHITSEFVDGKIVQEYAYYNLSEYVDAMQDLQAYNNLPADEKAITDAVNKVVDGWNTHNIANLKALSVPNLTRASNGVVDIKSIDEYESFMSVFVTAFPDFKVHVSTVDIADNKVYINWTVTGTHNGDFMGNAATGKKIKVPGFSVWTLNNEGQFVSEEAFFDNQAIYSQLGISPPKV
ncbi:hypothetical protein E1J38_008300 [Seonamhaeicola sediminis]|uniref:SnoaL-like domain-containing protein n=1 Tax=Seonamhaeicola sediminis TaxID=2528206 RepID=A0A562YEW9_9FLAO|nr:nuclear transport factor 2 family protein [Seonamhaeicola sediminis]TWO32856.1 hypothetical protein E1J38_008300 [Seonamhaeicola sediminis]